MKPVTLSLAKKNNETSVSNIFLDTYMRDANGEFVKVYLYLLRCMGDLDSDVTMSYIADRLNLTEKDVVRALKYWAGNKVLDVVFDEDGNEPVSITFLPLEEGSTVTEQSAATVETPASEGKAKTAYSPAKIKRLKEQDEIKQLLYIVERYLNKTLTSTEIGILMYIHEDLHFSSELIEYLVEYCVTNQHISLRYMEKVALSWHEKGVTSVADAKEISSLKSNRTNIVCKTFGITDRNMTPVEMDFINRWYDEYGFDKEMIAEACKRTIINMSKPNFSYADGILKKWRTAGIHTITELNNSEKNYRAKITVPVTTKQTGIHSINKFNNFSQRTYNFDEMEKALISNNK